MVSFFVLIQAIKNGGSALAEPPFLDTSERQIRDVREKLEHIQLFCTFSFKLDLTS